MSDAVEPKELTIPFGIHFAICCLFGGYVVVHGDKHSCFSSIDACLAYIRKEAVAIDERSRENAT